MALPTPWRVVGSLDVMLAQLNSQWPFRRKGADGAIAGPNATPSSDHWPHRVPALGAGYVVTARDVTHDPLSGPDCGELAEALRSSRDPRIKYVIWNRRIFSNPEHSHASLDWGWRAYSGESPHTDHLHVSVRDLPIADDRRLWTLQVGGGNVMSTFAERLIEAWNGGFDRTGQGEDCYLTVRTRREEERITALTTAVDRVEATLGTMTGGSGGASAEAIVDRIFADPRLPALLEQAVEDVMARVGLVVRPKI